MFACKSIYSL